MSAHGPGAPHIHAGCFAAGRLATMALACLAFAVPCAIARTVDVHAVMSKDGSRVYFDPAGLHIQPGDTVRWVQTRGYHSVTAYDPANGNHERRIPVGAKPWDSGILLGEYPAKGSTFERTFNVQGVYDYFCEPHEAAGMVGRIVVGVPGNGPGAQLSDMRRTSIGSRCPDRRSRLSPRFRRSCVEASCMPPNRRGTDEMLAAIDAVAPTSGHEPRRSVQFAS